jgi:hypothetical protein
MLRCEFGHILCNAPSCTAPNKCHYCAGGVAGIRFVEGMCLTCWGISSECGCFDCPVCSVRQENENLCAECLKCTGCCVCPRCITCSKVATICEDCSKCYPCCKCRRVRFKQRDIVFKDSNTFKKNESKRMISVELEISGCVDFRPIEKMCNKWSISVVHDGSLNGNNPFELNTSPVNGDLFLLQIADITRSLEESGSQINDSCGFHVHVDARDFDYWEIEKLIRLYSVIEPTLFKMVPAVRRSNRFCTKCGENLITDLDTNLKNNKVLDANGRLKKIDIKSVIADTIYKEDKSALQTMRISKYAGGSSLNTRYNALNIHSWVYRGSIESRLYQGTTKYEDITNWSMMWASILDYTYTTNFKKLPKDGLELLQRICSDNVVASWISAKYHNSRGAV